MMTFRRYLLLLPCLAISALSQIVINEIHYNPPVKTEWVEFIELYNRGSTEVDVSGWSISGGVRYQIPGAQRIGPNGYLVIAQDPRALKQKFGVDSVGPWEGLLSNKGETVTVKDGSGGPVDSVTYQEGFPWPTVGDLPGASIELVNPAFDNDLGGNWRPSVPSLSPGNGPTPGARNSVFSGTNPPQIRQVSHSPIEPRSGDTVFITAKITDPEGVASVRLDYQVVDPGNYIDLNDPAYATSWTSVSMHDDGFNGDQTAGDATYTIALPSNLQVNRRLLRYRISATDGQGASVRVPYSDDPQPNFAYYVYDGVPEFQAAIQPGSSDSTRAKVQTYSAAEMGRVPVYQLISKQTSVESATWTSKYTGSDYKWWGTMVYDGKVYDHIRYRARGGVWRYAMGKNMWKFDLNRGHEFEARDNYGNRYKTSWTKINLGAMIQQGDYQHRGEQGMFESVGLALFDLAGIEAPRTHWITLRVVDKAAESVPNNQYAGDFWGLYLAVEQEDGRFLDEHGLEDGNFYKMEGGSGTLNNQGLTAVSDGSDLASFLSTYRNNNPGEEWWRQNFDVSRYYSYQAIVQGIHHYDICDGKNYFYYLDPLRNQWSVHPWDLDLTWADNMYNAGCGGIDEFKDRLLPKAPFTLEYYNRIRELRDLLFNSDQAGKLIDEYAGIIQGTNGGPNLLAADRSMWDYNPIMANGAIVNTGKAGQGKYYQFPLESANDSSLRGSFDAVMRIMKNYVNKRGQILDNLSGSLPFPIKPVIQYTGSSGYPVNALQFESSPYSGLNSFSAMQWRVGEVRTATPGIPGIYEIIPVWESGELYQFLGKIGIPSGPLKVGHSYRARARFKDSTGAWGHWSDPVEFTTSEPDNSAELQESLKITELMYNPAASSEFEYVELFNSSTNVVLDLGGIAFKEGIDFVLPTGANLNPGEYALVVKADPADDFAIFRAYYNIDPEVKMFGPYSGSLDNGGERLTLKTASAGSDIVSFSYQNGSGWPIAANGAGHSLVPLSSALNREHSGALEYGGNWIASRFMKGSPGRAEPATVPGLLINEIAAHTTYTNSIKPEYESNDWIELYNPGGPINLADYYLSDDPSNLRKFHLPSGDLPPQSRVTFDEVTGFHSPITNGFGLSKSGENLYLSYLPGTGEDRVIDAVHYKGQEFGSSIGRYPDGVGYFVNLQPTRGLTNVAQPSSLLIQEVMYHPPDDTNALDNTWGEYFSIYNNTDSVILLNNSNGAFRVSGGIDYSFPTQYTIPPRKSVILTSFDPSNPTLKTQFLSRYALQETNVLLLGPYTGKLGNATDRITLEKPIAGGGTNLLLIWVPLDEVIYGDQGPWPDADGNGFSLHRISPNIAGSDPSNWNAATPSPGSDPEINADSDHDGIPDLWEISHGFNPHDAADAQFDADHDGLSNLAEYIAGTNPSDSSSNIKLSAHINSGAVQLSFPTVGGKNYRVEFRDGWETSWQLLKIVNGDGMSAVADDASPAVRERYYRAVLITP